MGGAPYGGGIGFDGGFKKNCKMGVVPPTIGTPVVGYFCWEGVNTPLDAMHHGNLELHLPPV